MGVIVPFIYVSLLEGAVLSMNMDIFQVCEI